MLYQKPLHGDPADLTGRLVGNMLELSSAASVLGKAILVQDRKVTPGSVKAIKFIAWVDRHPGIGRATDGDNLPRLLSLDAWKTYSQTALKMAAEVKALIAEDLEGHPGHNATVALLAMDVSIATGTALTACEQATSEPQPRF